MSPTFFSLLLILAAAAMPDASREQWRLVYRDGRIESRTLPPAAAMGEGELSHAWTWSDRTAPRRVEAEQVGKGLLPEVPARLLIRIAGWDPRSMAGLRVVAGPLPMWSEIPEAMMPGWPVPPEGRLTVPVDPGSPWRVRLESAGRGGWWTDLPAGSTTAVLPVASGPGFDLLVLGSDGRPLDGARLLLTEGVQGRRGGPKRWALYHAEQGRAAAGGLPDLEELTAVVSAENHAPAVLRGRLADLSGTVRLGAGAVVTGRFMDPAGQPLAGVRVHLEAGIGPDLPGYSVWRGESGGDGSWKLTGVPPGRAALLAALPGFVPHREELDLSPGVMDFGAVRLRRGTTLRVAVTDDACAAVAEAEVSAGPSMSARTDAMGFAVLPSVAPDVPLTLQVRAPGHVSGRAEVEPPFAAPATVVLDRAFRVRGRFLDPKGTPVADGLVQVRRGNFSSSHDCEPDGRFEIDLPPSTAAFLTLASSATRELRLALEPGLPGEVRDLGDLRPPRGREASGRLVSARDGEPVAGARVWMPRPSEQGALLAWVDRDILQGVSGVDGRFRLSGLPESPLVLRIDAAGFARMHLPVTPAGEDVAVDLGDVELAAGTVVRVSVPRLEEGPALARLDLRGDGLEMDMLTALLRDGLAVFRDVPPGRVRVHVERGRSRICEKTVSIDAGDDTVDVECTGAARVRGTVRIGGRPAGGGTLAWLPPALDVPGRIEAVVSPAGLRKDVVFGAGRPQVDVRVAEDGSFVTDELTPGGWQVSWVADAGTFGEPQSVEIPVMPEGSEYRADLSFPGARVAGTVVDSERNPVAGARVRDLAASAVAWTDEEGAFELTGLTPGRRSLRAEYDDLVSAVADVDVHPDRAGEPVRLVLGERQDPEVRIHVLDVEGAPVPGAFVILEEDGRIPRLLTTDSGGRVAARIEPPLPARVRVAALAEGAWVLGSWHDLEQAREGIVLTAASTGSLDIESAGAQGTPRLVSTGGWDLAWLLTLLGSRPALAPGVPLSFEGLPEGRYTVLLGSQEETAVVRGGERSRLRIGE